MNTAIIGAGIGGIATSIRMAVKGHKVKVFEANHYPGGKLTTLQVGNYRFDAGPSLFTMPQYIEELFALANEPIEKYFSYKTLETVCHYFWEDGTLIEAYAKQEDFAKEVAQKLGVPETLVPNVLKASERKYHLTGKTFLEKSLHKPATWLTGSVANALFLNAPLMMRSVFQTMDSENSKKLKHPKLVQLFNRFATYNGSNPYKAPAMLNIIPHFEHNIGAFFPIGGMQSITNALFALAKKLGVEFYFGKKVDCISVEEKTVNGIFIEERFHPFDTVISNMDVFPTYKKLLPREKHPEKTLHQPRSTSALIFYWGIKKSFNNLDLHNILFSENYKQEFDLLDKGQITNDPTVYIHISSKHCKTDAPEGHENWFTMINVPANQNQDWDILIKEARKNIIQKINRTLQTNIEPLIEVEDILDPRTIESRTSSYQGALYGTSSNNQLAAFLRHPNFSNRLKGLYFCGGSVHPGGGIPLCLLSAKILGDLIK